jgi:hypothetical protein
MSILFQPLNTAGTTKAALYNGICGGRFGTAAGMAGSTTVCCKSKHLTTPIVLFLIKLLELFFS